jgi:hypothetical protein
VSNTERPLDDTVVLAEVPVSAMKVLKSSSFFWTTARQKSRSASWMAVCADFLGSAWFRSAGTTRTDDARSNQQPSFGIHM